MAFEMQPHQLRVVQEKRELDEKREKLLQFFNTPTFRKLPQSEKTLLRLQHSIMGIYSDILNQRIRGLLIQPLEVASTGQGDGDGKQ